MLFVRMVTLKEGTPQTHKAVEAWRYVEFLNKLLEAREEAANVG